MTPTQRQQHLPPGLSAALLYVGFDVCATLLVHLGADMWCALSGCALAAALIGTWLRRSREDRPSQTPGRGCVVPVALAWACGQALAAAMVARDASVASTAAVTPMALAYELALAPWLEETVFRGLALDGHDGWVAALVSSALFAAVHGDAVHLLPMLGLGMALAWMRVRTGSIRWGVMTHVAYNACALMVWPTGLAGSLSQVPVAASAAGLTAIAAWCAVRVARHGGQVPALTKG